MDSLIRHFKSQFALPKKYHNLDGYTLFNDQAIEAGRERNEINTRLAYHIYMMLYYQLYTYIPDPDDPTKPMFGAQEKSNFVEYACDAWGISRSTAWAMYSATKVALFLKFDTYDKIMEQGGIGVFMNINNLLVTNRDGAVLKLKYGQPPEGIEVADLARQAIIEHNLALLPEETDEDSPEPRVRERREQLLATLAPDKPEIGFYRDPLTPLSELTILFQVARQQNGDLKLDSGRFQVFFPEGTPNFVKLRVVELLRVGSLEDMLQ